MNTNKMSNNESPSCFRCKKPVSSYHNHYNDVLVTTEKDYQSRKNSFGMYCPECDHSICAQCLDSINSISDVKGETSRQIVSVIEKTNVDVEPEKRGKYIIWKCPTCGVFFGDLSTWKTEQTVNLMNKIKRGEDFSLDEIGKCILYYQIFTIRLIKRNLIKDRVEIQRNILESIIINFALPKGQREMQKSLEEKRLNDTRAICNLLVLWLSLLKDRAKYLDRLKPLLSLFDQLQSPTIKIPAGALIEQFEKIKNKKV